MYCIATHVRGRILNTHRCIMESKEGGEGEILIPSYESKSVILSESAALPRYHGVLINSPLKDTYLTTFHFTAVRRVRKRIGWLLKVKVDWCCVLGF